MHLQLDISSLILILLSQFLDFLPSSIKLIAKILEFSLFLIELSLGFLDVTVQEIIIFLGNEWVTTLSVTVVDLISHKTQALIIERDESKGSTTFPLFVKLFKFEGQTIFLREVLWIALKGNFANYDV